MGVIRAVAVAAMPDAPVDSWRLMIDPDVVSKIDCGVSMLDAPTEVFATVMAYLGRDPNSDKAADVKAFEEHMMKVRSDAPAIHSEEGLFLNLAAI